MTKPNTLPSKCPRCRSDRWIGYGMWPDSGPIKRQCVPCGTVYDHPTPPTTAQQDAARDAYHHAYAIAAIGSNGDTEDLA